MLSSNLINTAGGAVLKVQIGALEAIIMLFALYCITYRVILTINYLNSLLLGAKGQKLSEKF